MKRSRNWVFTLHNYTDEDYETIINVPCKYVVIGKELGESGETKHLQGYIEFENGRNINGIKRLFKNNSVHLEIRRGTNTEASEYCKKENNWEERGTMSEQGKRTDLIEIAHAICNNEITAEELLLENPTIYSKARNTILDLETIRLREIKRTEKTECIWYFGKTGCGKSHETFEEINNYNSYYVWPDDGQWWDDYSNQELVIIDDFRGNIKYAQLLKLCDKWEVLVPRRGKPPIPFTSKKIIITSVLRPEEVYKNLGLNDSLKQLYRRIKLVYICNLCRNKVKVSCEVCSMKNGTEVGTEVQEGNTSTSCTCDKSKLEVIKPFGTILDIKHKC